ncbi:MAG: hypothetical protein ABIR47_13205 [Candidatus Kapaibacterium sp.]
MREEKYVEDYAESIRPHQMVSDGSNGIDAEDEVMFPRRQKAGYPVVLIFSTDRHREDLIDEPALSEGGPGEGLVASTMYYS